jgi:hypothetical protein
MSIPAALLRTDGSLVRSQALPSVLSFLLVLLVGTVARAEDQLAIALQPNQAIQLKLQGLANKNYVIQNTDDLASENWTTLSMGVTDAAGLWQQNDTTALPLVRFYRATLLPELQTTTSSSATLENNSIVIILGGSDPLQPGDFLQAIITQLPASGSLEQFDGTPITALGTVVTNPHNRVIFVPASNGVNPAGSSTYASFAYELKRASDGATSLPQTVGVSVTAPVGPVPTTPRPQVTEDVSLIFPLTASDPNPPPGGGALNFIIVTPCIEGRLYQVGADDVTQGAVILSSNVTVTNAHHLLMYVPQGNRSGYAYETFTYRASNSFGLLSNSVELPIDIAHVNHAPIASSSTFLKNNNDPLIEFNVSAEDNDGDTISYYFTKLPTKGTLYYRAEGLQYLPVVVGQACPRNDFEYYVTGDGSCLGSWIWGDNFDSFSFYAQDPSGLVSDTVTDTFNIRYINLPPTPTGPTAYSPSVNTGTQDVTSPSAKSITLTATDPDGDTYAFEITALPTHGALYFENVNLNTSGFPFPIELTTSSQTPTVIYVADPAYNSSEGLDSFTYNVHDDDTYPCPVTVTLAVSGPVITSQPAITVGVDSSGGYASNGAVTGFGVVPDATNQTSPSDGQLTLTLLPVTGNGSTTSAGGTFVIVGTPRGINVTHPSGGGIAVRGVPVSLNNALAAGNIVYQGNSTTGGSYLSISVQQLTGTALTTQYYLSVIYQSQFTGNKTLEPESTGRIQKIKP